MGRRLWLKILLLGCSLSFFSLPAFSAEYSGTSVASFSLFSTKPATTESSNWLKTREARSNNYKMTLAQQATQPEPQTQTQESSEQLSTALLSSMNNQLGLLTSLDIQWRLLEERSRTLSQTNSEISNLLTDSRKTIDALQKNLDVAIDRMMDSENGALLILDENEKLFQDVKNQLALIAKLQADLARAKKWGKIGTIGGFVLGAVAGGIATYFLTN